MSPRGFQPPHPPNSMFPLSVSRKQTGNENPNKPEFKKKKNTRNIIVYKSIIIVPIIYSFSLSNFVASAMSVCKTVFM